MDLCCLKSLFTSAPILQIPDPECQFVVEVGASDMGVGAVLSQCSATVQMLHPCALFSLRLSPAERNYDIGNRELLAVKMALEEWWHWLEGTKERSLVLTDHKNLESIHSGPCSLPALISPSPTTLGPATPSLMPSPSSFRGGCLFL